MTIELNFDTFGTSVIPGVNELGGGVQSAVPSGVNTEYKPDSSLLEFDPDNPPSIPNAKIRPSGGRPIRHGAKGNPPQWTGGPSRGIHRR